MINLKNNRILQCFNLNGKIKKCLICYIVCGYPDINSTLEIVDSLVNGGADIIELGIPFSDPIADGPTIQEASHFALTQGINPIHCLHAIKEIRKKYPSLPLIIMTYSNIVLSRGLTTFLKESAESGVDGFILPDLPIEESESFIKEASKLGLASIFLISPNTKDERVKQIRDSASGFLYLVSVLGVTGERKQFDSYSFETIKRIKKLTEYKLPLAVGFGISNTDHIKKFIEAGADGIIIGSAIIKKINEKRNKIEMLNDLTRYVLELKSSFNTNVKY